MIRYTCEKHPGMPAHHDDCDARGVSWSTIKLQTSLENLNNALFGSPPPEHVALIQDARMAHMMQKAIKSIEEDESDFLGYITDELSKWPCMHEEGTHKNTPPMFWPELIGCIVKRAVKDAMEKREPANA